jgi:hypothetical protein
MVEQSRIQRQDLLQAAVSTSTLTISIRASLTENKLTTRRTDIQSSVRWPAWTTPGHPIVHSR